MSVHICSAYGQENDIKFNAAKSMVIICKTKEDGQMPFPFFFFLSNDVMQVISKVKYLGHILTEDMSDDDIYRQCRASWNM